MILKNKEISGISIYTYATFILRKKRGNKMEKNYVAHPYGGKEENKEKVEKIIKSLAKKNQNIFYISPIHCIGYLYNDFSYEHGMEYCYELLSSCNKLILCEGWQTSKGCKLEQAYANEHHIPILYYHSSDK